VSGFFSTMLTRRRLSVGPPKRWSTGLVHLNGRKVRKSSGPPRPGPHWSGCRIPYLSYVAMYLAIASSRKLPKVRLLRCHDASIPHTRQRRFVALRLSRLRRPAAIRRPEDHPLPLRTPAHGARVRSRGRCCSCWWAAGSAGRPRSRTGPSVRIRRQLRR
jgi:hypothetical protein